MSAVQKCVIEHKTLSELAENQLATYWTRKLPAVSYGNSDTANQPLVLTRDIAPVVQYIVRNSKCRNILDADTLMDFDELWLSQSLERNGSVDSDSTLLKSLRNVLNCGFAVPVVRDNTLSIQQKALCRNTSGADLQQEQHDLKPGDHLFAPQGRMTWTRWW